MAHPLDGARAKLDRADEHIRRLYQEAKRLFEPHADRQFLDIGMDEGWHVVTSQPFPEVRPPFLAAICGDVIHNLRSSLDYVVSELIIAGHQQPTRHNWFPIFTDRDDWVKFVVSPKHAERSPLYRLDPNREPWTVIEQAQPFNTADPLGDYLALLNRFANRDKHRSLTVQMQFATTESIDTLLGWDPNVPLLEKRILTRPLSFKERTELVRLRFPAGSSPNVYVKSQLQVLPGFGDEDWQMSPDGMQLMLNKTRALVESFERFLVAPP